MLKITHDISSNDDYYTMIGVKKSAPIGEVKRAINMMFRATHPDNGGDRTLFEHILEAKDVLLDPISKAIYDKTGLKKHDVKLIAKEFANNVVMLYSNGTKVQNEIRAVLLETYEEQLQELQTKLAEVEKDAKENAEILAELELDNFFMKEMATFLEARRNEIKEVIIMIEAKIKLVLAKIVVVSLVLLKTKEKEILKPAVMKFTVNYSTSGNNGYTRTSTSSY